MIMLEAGRGQNAYLLDNSAESNSTSKRERQLPDVLYEFCHTETRCLWTILLDHHKEPVTFEAVGIPDGVVVFAIQSLPY
jgi:hypothetical protein